MSVKAPDKDAVDSALVELTPVVQCRDDNAMLHIVGDPRHAFESPAIVGDLHPITVPDATDIGIVLTDHNELLALALLLVFHVGVAGVREVVALGRDNVERVAFGQLRVVRVGLTRAKIIRQRIEGLTRLASPSRRSPRSPLRRRGRPDPLASRVGTPPSSRRGTRASPPSLRDRLACPSDVSDVIPLAPRVLHMLYRERSRTPDPQWRIVAWSLAASNE